jgi:ribonucleoside-triphosphate reductase
MFQLKLDPVRDAGKFVYHLRSLTAAGLISLDKKIKRYELTELGRMIVSFARDMDEYVSVRRGKLYVRTSRLAIEEFHRNKISRSLVVEAGVPQEIADEIAAEAEDRLLRLKTVYLTAPLIREFVNAILIEKKLEEYRHKLTRLGLPVYDVAQLIHDAGDRQLTADYVSRYSAKSVLSEFALLNCLPHNIADAHLSGSIHIANLENWILKPNEVVHDLRYFLVHDFRGLHSPETLEGALALILNVLASCSNEVSGEQTLEFFNIFLSPYAKGKTLEELTRHFTYFLTSTGQDLTSSNPQKGISIVIDVDVPEFLSRESAIGPGGKTSGLYSDFADEALKCAEATVDAFTIVSRTIHALLPHLLIRIRKRSFADQRTRRIIEKAHELAAAKSIPYFALLDDTERTTYSATGLRLTDDWTEHWEGDCVRTGSMDSIFLNLPRLAYEAKKNDEKLLMLLRESATLAIEGFKVKRKFISERLKQPLLPLLAGSNGSVPYFYDKNASYNLAFVGLTEAVTFHVGKQMEHDKRANEFGLKIVKELSKLADGASGDTDMRIVVSQRPGDEAAGRLAELDIEEYGRTVVIANGPRGPPYYSDMPTIPLSSRISIENRILGESQIQSAVAGGHLNVVCVEPTCTAQNLVEFTKNAMVSGARFQTYTANYSLCHICNDIEKGIIPKCSKCGSDKLIYLGRSSYGLIPFNLWPEGKRKNVETRIRYSAVQSL